MRGIVRGALGCATSAVLLAVSGAGAMAQDLERGRLLHDNHCGMCHDSIAYKRSDRIAKNLAEVKAQVTRWQTNTGLRWTQEDIDSVAAYVAKRYYKFPLPGEGK